MFSIEALVEACRAAVAGTDPEKAVRALVTEAVREPGRVLAAMPPPERAGFRVVHREATMTVLDFAWAPWMCFKAHDHAMWSCVGIYTGREDNVFWRVVPGGIEAAGARSIGAGEAVTLGTDIIHSVVNPVGKMTRALHVYGGDFFAPPAPRREWDPETHAERPWDLDDARARFAAAEARARLG